MKFVDKIKGWIARFFYGRHGVDQLSIAMLLLALILSFIESFFKNEIVLSIFSLARLALFVLIILRALSKNRTKRYAENAKFLGIYGKAQSLVSGTIARVKDKDHRYYRCECGTYLRVPKGKGKIKITCSKCGKQMIKKS